MLAYVVGGLSLLLFLYDPIAQYISPEPRRLAYTPRPPINETLLALEANNTPFPGCPRDAYSMHILSKAPLVIYVENFTSTEEREHLLEISEPLFEPSTLTNGGSSTFQDTLIRDSEVAVVPRDDVVRCLEQRALSLQGWRDELWIERLRTQRYGARQHYRHHFDWGSGARGWGRVSSIMAWVLADGVDGGGTEFPLLRRNEGGRWCQWVECSGEKGGGNSTGVVFRPVAGNAVYWENFRPDGTGRGFEETWHAGLPVKQGVKVGLNIWSWGRLDGIVYPSVE